MSSCGRLGETDEQARVAGAFESWKQDMINQRIDQAMAYIPSHVDDYLNALNTGGGNSVPAPNAPPSTSPGVDLLLRTALEKKVSADLRAHLTLGALVRRIGDRQLFNPRDVREIDLGRISINGDHASAEVYYQGTLTALQLPFLKEGDAWKIDVMALLPYAELMMRVDRAIKGETEAQQVDQLVGKLPSL
ncbi:MAG TPA: hypothetical protein VGZ93_12660 [Candidatus Methylacidiphilales bacterium]|nr:hypothetical protein [Candidatus Methylacidiphilales bacterium]